MKICIPIKDDEGLQSKVNAHFGSASNFLIYDQADKEFEIITNSDSHHSHGMCHPLNQLMGKNIDVVICSGMGIRAVANLNEGGIQAFRIAHQDVTVEKILECFDAGELDKITPENACQEHHCH